MKTEFVGWIDNEITFDDCCMREDIIKVHNARIMKEYEKDKANKEPLFSYVATSIEDFAWLLNEIGFTTLDILKHLGSVDDFSEYSEIFYLDSDHDINDSDYSDAVTFDIINPKELAEYIWESKDEDCVNIVEAYEDDVLEEEEG